MQAPSDAGTRSWRTDLPFTASRPPGGALACDDAGDNAVDKPHAGPR